MIKDEGSTRTVPKGEGVVEDASPVQSKAHPLKAKRRSPPDFKRIPHTRFLVDAFRWKGPVHFLTHFHGDHYGGLGASFDGVCYTGAVTAALVIQRLAVPASRVRALPMDTPVVVEGVRVTLMDANHCPGAAIILFELPSGETVLHTGDFRWHPRMMQYPALQHMSLDWLYLDTTFCSPRYRFPPQQEVIDAVVKWIAQDVAEHPHKTLYLFGTYTIGKEKLFCAVMNALNVCMYVEPDKRTVLELAGFDMTCFTDNPSMTPFHVCSMSSVGFQALVKQAEAIRPTYERIVAVSPTGWNFRPSKKGSLLHARTFDNTVMLQVPYSEHSSFPELQSCVEWLRPKKLVPTVNTSSQDKVSTQIAYFAKWVREDNYSTLLPYFSPISRDQARERAKLECRRSMEPSASPGQEKRTRSRSEYRAAAGARSRSSAVLRSFFAASPRSSKPSLVRGRSMPARVSTAVNDVKDTVCIVIGDDDGNDVDEVERDEALEGRHQAVVSPRRPSPGKRCRMHADDALDVGSPLVIELLSDNDP